MSSSPGDPRAGWRLRLAPLAVVGVVYALTSYGNVRSPDAEVVFRTAESLAAGHGFRLEHDLAWWPGFGVARGRDGALYSVFGPGEALALAPIVAVLRWSGLPERVGSPPALGQYVGAGLQDGRPPDHLPDHALRWLASFFNVPVTLLMLLIFWDIAWRLTRHAGVATASMLALAFATPAWAYSGTFFSEPLLTLLLVFCFWCIARTDRRLGGDSGLATVWLGLAGLALGLAVLTHLTALLSAPFLAAYAVLVCREEPAHWWRAAGSFLLAFAIPLVWLGWFDFVRFGDVFESGRNVGNVAEQMGYGHFVSPWPALSGFLVGSGRSLIVYAPPALLGALGLGAFARRHRALAWIVGLGALARVLFVASRSDWHGGFAPGPRLLVATVPFLVLPAACLLLEWSGQVRKRLVQAWFACAALGVVVQAYLTTGEVFSYSRDLHDISDQIYTNWALGPLGHLLSGPRGPWMLLHVPLSNVALWLLISLVTLEASVLVLRRAWTSVGTAPTPLAEGTAPPWPARTVEVVWLAVLGIAFAALHLTSGHPFHRPLIDLDDRTIVGGLDGVSVTSYFSDRIWRPDAFAFPVRDLTYLWDHAVSHMFGIQTFVLSSVLLFLVYALLVYRWLKRTIPVPAALLLLTIVALHPANAEIVQWAISRKHLLVGIFTVAAALLVGRMTEGERRISVGEWIGLGALDVLSLLSHPTGALFPLWAGAVLLPKCRRQRDVGPLVGYLAVTLLVTWAWLHHVAAENSDYRGLSEQTGFALEGVGEQLRFLLLGLGRGTWQLLFPTSQAVYFNIDSLRNVAGLLLFAVGAAALGYLLRRLIQSQAPGARQGLQQAIQWFSLAALLLAPEAAFVMRRADFVMADRFLFLSLPYWLAGVYLVLSASDLSWISNLSLIRAARVSSVLGALYLVFCGAAALHWESELALYRPCVHEEGSDRCWFHYAAKLREAGCWEVAKEFGPMEAALKASASRKGSLFRPEGGLVLSLCKATVLGESLQARSIDLDALAGLGATEESLACARNLLAVEGGKPLDAFYRTATLFLVAGVDTAKMNQAILGAVTGQLEVLNALPALQEKGSGPALATLKARFGQQIDVSMMTVGRNMTLQALSRAPHL